jgi:hypothetical protein
VQHSVELRRHTAGAVVPDPIPCTQQATVDALQTYRLRPPSPLGPSKIQQAASTAEIKVHEVRHGVEVGQDGVGAGASNPLCADFYTET